MSELSFDELGILDRVKEKPELRPHFFSKIKKLKWFDVLVEKGFLDPEENPRPVNTKENYYSIPSWPVADYLVNSSEFLNEDHAREYAVKYLELIRNITNYAIKEDTGNYRTWWLFSKILRNIPLDLVTEDDIKLIDYWIADRFDNSLASEEIGAWLIGILESPTEHSINIALSVLNIVFDINVVDSRYSSEKKEPVLRVKDYQVNELVKSIPKKAGTVIGVRAVDLFKAKMEQVLDVNCNDKWSAIWRSAIEEHEQNRRVSDADDIVLTALRESIIGLFQSLHQQASESKLIELLSSDYKTIKRVAIYVAGEFFEKLNEETINKILDPEYFDDNYRHELWQLLNKNFNKFGDQDKELVLYIIEDMSVVNDDIAVNVVATAYKKSLWLDSIKNQDGGAMQSYLECIKISGTEPEHSDISSYSSSGPVIHESPIELSELRILAKTPNELVAFLNTYEYEGHFKEPGLEGLVKAFGKLVAIERDLVLDNSDNFLTLKPYFLHEFFNVFSTLWEGDEEYGWSSIWPRILGFASKLLDQNDFWNTPNETPRDAFVGNTNWVVGTLSHLIEKGCKNDNHSFGIVNVELSKHVLEKILERQEGDEFSETSDAVSIAINSPRGRCLEAYINLALYQCRNHHASTNDHAQVWSNYELIFTNELCKADAIKEYEFATLVANYLPNFIYLSEKWTLDNLEAIFDKTNYLKWLCAIQGYSYTSTFVPQVYKLFKERGDFVEILDNEFLKDKIEDRYIQFLCIGYLRGEENIDDPDSLFSILLSRRNYRELNQIIWFIWTMRDSGNMKVRELVYNLWPKLLDLTDGSTKEGRKLASRLCYWAVFVNEMDQTTREWLLNIASFAQEDYNGNILLEALARLSVNYPFDVFEIWKAMLQTYAYDYPDGAIKKIFKNLIEQGVEGVRAGKDIADLYLKHGTKRPTDWLNEALVDISSG